MKYVKYACKYIFNDIYLNQIADRINESKISKHKV